MGQAHEGPAGSVLWLNLESAGGTFKDPAYSDSP